MKDQKAVELGRKGGLKGGYACAASLTKDERSERARRAANKRWGKPMCHPSSPATARKELERLIELKAQIELDISILEGFVFE